MLGFTPAVADSNADIYKLIAKQLWEMEPPVGGTRHETIFAAGGDQLAMALDRGLVGFNSEEFSDHHGGRLESSRQSDVTIQLARDGKSAWLTFSSKMKFRGAGKTIDYRISEIAVKTSKGWLIAGGMWSEAASHSAVDAAASAGTIAAPAKLAGKIAMKPDARLAAAFTALANTGVDATAAARTDLVVYGSGPGERTVGGGRFARAWAATWVGNVKVDGPLIARVAPSGTTGWVIANVKLVKKKARAGAPLNATYHVPYRVLCVFDKTDKGWTLVHMHFATKP